jgi:HEAT repeat protein
MGASAEPAVPALLEALKDKDRSLRIQVLYALNGATINDKRLLPTLIEVLKKDESVEMRQAAVSLLPRFGEDALPHLKLALTDKDENLRWMAANSLGQLGPAAKKAIPDLVQVAKRDASANVRAYAVQAIAQTGPESVDILVEFLKEKDSSVRQIVVTVLGQFGARAKPAVPLLIEALKDKDATTRWMAAQTLGQIGPDAKAAIPALKEALKDKDDNVRAFAQFALQSIEGKGFPPPFEKKP